MPERFINSIIDPLLKSINTSNYLIYIKDVNDNFIYINDSAKRILNVNLDELRNKNFVEGSKEKLIYDNLFANDLKLLESQACTSRVYFIGKDDDPLSENSSFHFTKCPIVGEDGNPYLLGFGVDVTNWLVEEKTLNFFKTMLDSMTDSVMLTDPKYPYAIRYVNKAFEKLSGHTREESLGKSPTEILRKLDSEAARREKFNARISKHEICDTVLTNFRADGTEFKSHLRIIPLFHSNTEFPDYLMGIQRDITGTLRTKEQSRQKTQKLEALFNGTSNFLWLLDGRGNIEHMNLTARVSGKYVKQEAFPVQFKDGRWWKANTETQVVIEELISKLYSTGKKQSIRSDLLNSVDDVVRVRIIATPYRNNLGNIGYVVIEATDVTELEKEKEKAEAVARGVVSKNRHFDSSDPEDVVRQWQKSGLEGEELERVVRMETVVYEDVKPTVERLDEAVHDPKKGLIVGQNEIREAVLRIDKKMETTDSLFSTLKFASKIPAVFKSPIVKWSVIGLISIGTVDVLSNGANNLVRFLEFVTQTELIAPENSESPNSTPF
jgi:PAS domain S-box-containing protein